MLYRKLGKTNLFTSVFTLGGMRYLHGWNAPYHEISEETLKQAYDVTEHVLKHGINHIETARAYGKSEFIYGKVLKMLSVKREDVIITTKIGLEDSETAYKQIQETLKRLQVDYIDILDIHGINIATDIRKALKKGGTLEGIRKAQKEGLVRFVGFSTHGLLNVILKTIMSEEFDVVNLHYYYVFQQNLAAISLAESLKMGVFIISPNNKGGLLYGPSGKLKSLCDPLDPIVFNNRFLLANMAIHTLSVGITEPEMLNIHLDSLKKKDETPLWDVLEREIEGRLRKELTSLKDYCTVCQRCLPCPEKINIPETIRLFNLFEAFEMQEYARKRYSDMKPDDRWIQGENGDKCTSCDECLDKCPQKLNIPFLLKEAHKIMSKNK